MVQIIKVDPKVSSDIYSIQVSIETRTSVISTMISNNMNIQNDMFKLYQSELEDLRKASDKMKADLQTTYIKPVIDGLKVSEYNWSLNAMESAVILTYET